MLLNSTPALQVHCVVALLLHAILGKTGKEKDVA